MQSKAVSIGRGAWCVVVFLVVVGCSISAEPTPTPQPLGRANNTPTTTNTTTIEPTDTEIPTDTPTATPDWSPTPGPSPTPSDTPTRTPRPTNTKRPTRTPSPTASPTPERQLVPGLSNTTPIVREGALTPAVPIPTAVAQIPLPPKTSNILLLGSDDAELGGGVQRTDTIIIVSINRETNTAAMVSLPRDMYIYMPGWTMNKINTAAPFGGISMLKEAILYNFGIPIHYHARVDFNAFQQIIDAVGGVYIPVSCELTDWRLKEPGLDIFDEDNWELFTMEPGIHVMDGDTALWYARSRKSTNDFDRGRRQQQILRALVAQGVNTGLVWEVPELWSTYRETVESDLDIGRILQFAAAAPEIRDNGIQSIYLAGDNVIPTQIETRDGVVTVQLPNEAVIHDSFRRLYQPPALNRGARQLTVEIVNGTGDDELALLAAENLAWHGFVPIHSEEEVSTVDLTTLTFHADNLRGSFDWLITWIFDLKRPGDVGNGAYEGDGIYGIDLDSDADSEYNYRVVLGEDYDPCRPELFAPRPFTP